MSAGIISGDDAIADVYDGDRSTLLRKRDRRLELPKSTSPSSLKNVKPKYIGYNCDAHERRKNK